MKSFLNLSWSLYKFRTCKPFVPPLIWGQSQESITWNQSKFLQAARQLPFQHKGYTQRTAPHMGFETTAASLKMLNHQPKSKNTHTSRRMLHRHAPYCNPRRNTIKLSKRLILIKVVTEEWARGGRLWGAPIGTGLAVRGQVSSQAAQMPPTEGERGLPGRSRASCLRCLALPEEKVPGCFSTMPPFPSWASKGERAQGNRRDLKITVTFKAFCKASGATVQQNKDSTKNPVNHRTKPFCKDW